MNSRAYSDVTLVMISPHYTVLSPKGTVIKGNLAHNFRDTYFSCLSIHLDISNMLKTKSIENIGLTCEVKRTESKIWKSPKWKIKATSISPFKMYLRMLYV